ncbi:plasmid stabilization protein [Candidatus Palauibacter sp.]|uniref:plasmid stabilization protein n=1 Tax=Candidatus Palauibacter sp. TaxID=3101350 RepID=UPI003B0248C6
MMVERRRAISIRNPDDDAKRRRRIGAEEDDRSNAKGLGTAIHELFSPLGGVELEIPPREPMREPPRFD